MEYAMLPPDAIAGAKAAVREGKAERAKSIGAHGVPVAEEEEKLRAEGKSDDPMLEDLADGWAGYFLQAETVTGNEAKCSFVGADGYYETARVAIETALLLRFERERLPYTGGVL